jgi:uncharacterized membrane protein YgaE (UPF0421/DUF939 family)
MVPVTRPFVIFSYFNLVSPMKQTYITFTNLIYIIKCLLGLVICYIFYTSFPQYPFNWALVSVVLALSPDHSNKQAFSRMIANLLGAGVGLLVYFIPLPNLALICMGAVLVIALCFIFKLTDIVRIALAALVIVMLQGEKIKHWYIPLERMMCVIFGCVVAVILTVVFNSLPMHRKRIKTV